MQDQIIGFVRGALLWPGPVGALMGLAGGGLAWALAGGSAARDRWPRAEAPVRTWSAAIAAACAMILVVWVWDRFYADLWEAAGSWLWAIAPLLPWVPIAIAAHVTLNRTDIRGLGGARRTVHAAATMLLAYLWLLFTHRMCLAAVFPFAGGEFHAMFAYTADGRVHVARTVWLTVVAALGLTTAGLVLLAGVRWWAVALVASGVGVLHWWDVVTWTRQSADFHLQAWLLLLTLPLALFAVAGFAAALRRRARVSPVAIDSPAAPSELVAPRHSVEPVLNARRNDEHDQRDGPHA